MVEGSLREHRGMYVAVAFPVMPRFRRKMYAYNGGGSGVRALVDWFNLYHVTDGGEYPSNTTEAQKRGLLTWERIMQALHRHLLHFNQVEVRPWLPRADDDEET